MQKNFFLTPLILLLLTAPIHAAKPNFIVILADDLGYGDLGCYGHPVIRTPCLDRMAKEGLRFTSYYSPSEVCTPSRAGLLTGRYPVRSGMSTGRQRVLFPKSVGGLPQSETTIAKALKSQGYATAQIGKWHLGIHPGSKPNDHGFDYSFGLPYSNDMDPNGVQQPFSSNPPSDGWNVPLWRNGQIIERPAKQDTLTKRYTMETIDFIKKQKQNPFLIYLAHTMPHTPLFASPEFKGKSPRGIYGDTVEELDASVGSILNTLRDEGLDKNTFVFFTSDNGPWLIMGAQGGSAGLLKEGKGSTWEGGMRVPAIAWAPGRISPAVTRQVASSLDLFPTLLSLAGGPLPNGTIIDGADLSPLLLKGQPLEERPFFFYRAGELFACRLGSWKTHFFTQAGYGEVKSQAQDPPLLFNLDIDPSEKFNRAKDYPDVLGAIRLQVAKHKEKLVPGEPQLK